MKTREEVLEYLIKGAAFHVTFNMNDTFYWGCADSCEMPTSDLLTLLELVAKYDYDAIIAYEAINRGHDSDHEEINTDQFRAAKEEILKNLSDTFCPQLNKIVNIRKEEMDIFNGKIVLYRPYKRTFLDKLISFLKREKYYTAKQVAYLESGESAVGFNIYNAKDNLIKAYQD